MAPVAQHFFFALVESGSVLVHTRQNPTDAEWTEYLQALRKVRPAAPPWVLVFTDGGGPTPAQRQALTRGIGGQHYTGAVLGDAPVTRFIIASMALMNADIRTFHPDELEAAFLYLKLSPAQRAGAEDKMRALFTGPAAENAALQKALACLAGG